MKFQQTVEDFLQACQEHQVKMMLVGGGAVNFHGYQRHSADVDFWIELTTDNLASLKDALSQVGVEIDAFPKPVIEGLQNISIKISPVMEIELITRFNPGKSFEEAYQLSVINSLINKPDVTYRILSYDDLINSKIKSGRPKDILDIQELERFHKDDDGI